MSSGLPNQGVWRRESITPQMEDVLRALRKRAVLDRAYLAGGTGLALRFGHRLSVDLDFFLSDPFDEETLLQRFQLLPDLAVVQRAPQTLHLTIQGVKLSLFSYLYPLLFPTAAFEDNQVADPRDIACMKITAIASRGSKRDFVDLYAACERFGLSELMMLFSRKYARVGYNRLPHRKVAHLLRRRRKGAYAAHAHSTRLGPT